MRGLPPKRLDCRPDATEAASKGRAEAARKAALQKQYSAEEDVSSARSYESEVDGPTGRVRDTTETIITKAKSITIKTRAHVTETSETTESKE